MMKAINLHPQKEIPLPEGLFTCGKCGHKEMVECAATHVCPKCYSTVRYKNVKSISFGGGKGKRIVLEVVDTKKLGGQEE